MFLPKIELLARDLLVKTSEVDHADWNYRPILGKLQRVRFQLVKSLLRDTVGQSLLEVGYGSGVFMPELRQHCEHISGIDIHRYPNDVMGQLKKAGIKSDLHSGSVCQIPLEAESQDIVVAVSALEYVDEIDIACQEIDRVLKKDGILTVVTPGKSPILDAGLQLLGGENAEENYGDRREKLISALTRHFDVQKERRWPWPGLPWLTVYKALRLAKRS